MFGIGMREMIVVAFVLVLLFGLPFWVRVGRGLVKRVKDAFKLD